MLRFLILIMHLTGGIAPTKNGLPLEGNGFVRGVAQVIVRRVAQHPTLRGRIDKPNVHQVRFVSFMHVILIA
jgi:hypothetical protein